MLLFSPEVLVQSRRSVGNRLMILWANIKCGIYYYFQNFGLVRLNCRIRNYANKKSDPLCPPPKPKSEASTGTAVTLGLITFAGVATIGYAKYDKNFRKFLGDNIPGADGFFKFIFMEEGSITDSISEYADSILNNDCKTTTGPESSAVTKKDRAALDTKEKTYTRRFLYFRYFFVCISFLSSLIS